MQAEFENLKYFISHFMLTIISHYINTILIILFVCLCLHLAIKRKATTGTENPAKRSKLDSSNKEETGNNLQQQKEIGYQTNIAICEIQLEELKYVMHLFHHY